MSAFRQLVDACDAEIKAGHSQQAVRRLANLNITRVPREWRLPLANVCRRAGLVTLGMKLLTRLVHPADARGGEPASSAELAEYAVLLQRAGAVSEALQTLARVDTRVVPEAWLYRAFCHFNEWEGRGAVQALRAYLDAPVTPYWQLVGRVNLAAAYLLEDDLSPAIEVVEQNIAEAESLGAARLLGNCLELRAQIHLRGGSLSLAKEDLASATRVFGEARILDQIFVRKWQAIIEANETRSTAPLEVFREEAVARRIWEAVREADLFALKISFSEKRFHHLIFGTPFASYRARICRELGRDVEADSFILGAGPCLDVTTGSVDGVEPVSRGRKSHQLVEILLRDFYVPRRLGGLFADLFPDERFDVFSSPDRVHQILRRTRRAIETAELPVEIVEGDGAYSVRFTGEFAFRVPLNRVPVISQLETFSRLQGLFGDGGTFSAGEARERLAMPRTSFQRLVTWGLEHGHLVRLSASRSTRYGLVRARGA